jgi:uncharacterized SAM-binding protein YcdF (DUF218 family)
LVPTLIWKAIADTSSSVYKHFVRPLLAFLRNAIRILIILAALLFALQIFFAFAGLPGWAYHLISLNGEPQEEVAPRYIVVLGGGGIPSESGLIRTYYAAHIGTNYPNATFIVALPASGNPDTNSVGRMRDELVMRCISSNSIHLESKGLSTHEQAVNIREMLPPDAVNEPILIVTSAYHIKRAVLCFRKLGFTRLANCPAVDVGPEVTSGSHILMRYSFWANLEAQIQIVRECCALVFYRIQGWI